jgi:starvation-inducible DNA-binding protein
MELIELMKATLGTAFSLYVATHGAHWNVEGPDFYQLHKMLEEQYRDIWESLDDIAEHLRALDAYAPQSMEHFIQLSRIPGAPAYQPGTREMLAKFVQAHEVLIALMKETLHAAEQNDQQGIVNYLGARIEMHQKHRWMLRASAQAPSTGKPLA